MRKKDMEKRKSWSKVETALLYKKWQEGLKTLSAKELTSKLAKDFRCSEGGITWRIAGLVALQHQQHRGKVFSNFLLLPEMY